MRAGVAAGHPATVEVGSGILAEGGTAADAVVAMCLASCVAETVYSGLLAGCHAIQPFEPPPPPPLRAPSFPSVQATMKQSGRR